MKEVFRTNSILNRHVASVNESKKEVVRVGGYIGHIYEGGRSRDCECLHLRLFGGYKNRRFAKSVFFGPGWLDEVILNTGWQSCFIMR